MHYHCKIRAPSPAPADQLDSVLAWAGSGNATGADSASLCCNDPDRRVVRPWSAPGEVGGAPVRPHPGRIRSGMHILNAWSAACKPQPPRVTEPVSGALASLRCRAF